MPDPIGYICTVTDPDGNVVEFSYGQGCTRTVRAKWERS
jgi:lactoylglutathione lyase